jgi:hypothetical protein
MAVIDAEPNPVPQISFDRLLRHRPHFDASYVQDARRLDLASMCVE